MKVVNITVDKNHATGNTIAIPIFLTEKIENIGIYEDLGGILDVTTTQVTVTGTTDSKLSEVRGFDYNTPYTVGVNGVSKITADQIEYSIGGINYITHLADESTVFSFTDSRDEYKSNNFVSEDKNITYVDSVDIEDSVFIERESISVIEYFSKLRQIGSVSEIATFNNGFYKINNQTI